MKKTNDVNKFNESRKKETDINMKLFMKHFSSFQRPSNMFKQLYITNDKEKNKLLVNVIKSGIQDLNKEIEKMSEKKKKLKRQMR